MVAQSTWETRKHDDRTAKDADQAEFLAVRYGSCHVESGTFDDRVADALDDYEVPDPIGVPYWAATDMKFDSAVSDIALEIQRRTDLMGAKYPFKMDGNHITYHQSRTLVYEFCLAVSLAPSLNEGEYVRLPRVFEYLVRDLLRCFLGDGSEGIRTGWPGNDYDERPTKFRDLIKVVHNRCGEFFWSPDPGLPADPSHQDVKDEGVDVIVWKPLLDDRPGKLFLLCQCACGDDWVTKFNDIDPALMKLGRWMKPVCWALPMRVFCLPRHIPNEPYFAQVNKDAGLTLDRARLTLLAEQDECQLRITEAIGTRCEEAISLVITGFTSAQPAPARRRRRGAVGRRSR